MNNYRDCVNEIYKIIGRMERIHSMEKQTLQSQLDCAAKAHEDLVSNYAIVNKNLIDHLTVTYPCQKCGRECEVADIETFNPDFYLCGDLECE
jgi:hypothetical protein